ncbi:Protein kri1 [Porphyridium purpureum]|uniref:Protein kri1 n=1 Tax=Porphyridium purpureum TaxID=35688 RepID=A0A5J4YW52_PORPP|nr:Protein kri1 [Porphyridium purpureum]|eukprot:POR4465..scf227_4
MPRKKKSGSAVVEAGTRKGSSDARDVERPAASAWPAHLRHEDARGAAEGLDGSRARDDDDDEEEEEDDEELESEDENAKLLTKRLDQKIAQTYTMLINKDAQIYDKGTHFFDDEKSDQDTEREEAKSSSSSASGSRTSSDGSDDEPVAGFAVKTSAPMKLKDYAREKLLRQMSTEGTGDRKRPEDASGSDGEADGDGRPDAAAHVVDDGFEPAARTSEYVKSFIYDEDQAKLRAEVLGAIASDSESVSGADGAELDDGAQKETLGNGLLTKKAKTRDDTEREAEDEDLALYRAAMEAKEAELAHEYLEKETAEQKEAFLREYVLNNGWIEREREDANDGEKASKRERAQQLHLARDEQFLEDADRFEYAQNFRFEDPEGAQRELMSYARSIDGTMRRKDERRRLKRLAKMEKKQLDQTREAEKIKREKNLRKARILERMRELGIDLDADFDPLRWDELVSEAFAGREGNHEEDEQRVRDELDDLLEQYYDLEYNVGGENGADGGGTMRFKYREVERETFGLDAEEVLEMDDAELNKMVPLKYLATYRPPDTLPKKLRAASRSKSKAQFLRREAREQVRQEKEKRREARQQNKADARQLSFKGETEETSQHLGHGDDAPEPRRKHKDKRKMSGEGGHEQRMENETHGAQYHRRIDQDGAESGAELTLAPPQASKKRKESESASAAKGVPNPNDKHTDSGVVEKPKKKKKSSVQVKSVADLPRSRREAYGV